MRLYKLLKDTPTIKAGTTFREVVSDFDGARELARYEMGRTYRTEEEAKRSIMENREDWLIYFGIKEEE